MKDDEKYLKLAIKKSEESFLKGFFPAGAIIVKNGKILSSEISSLNYKHAEQKALEKAFKKFSPFNNNCTLYASMEPCLMCLSVAYWTGIRRIVFACDKQSISLKYFETSKKNQESIKILNEKIDFIQIKALKNSSLKIIKKWEKINNVKS